MVASSTEEPAYFEVCDLAADPRFSQLNIVEELELTIVECLCTSFTRFTAEPSLTCCSRRTNNKIVIGTVFVLDDKVREPISVQHLHCK
jgi:hypothetical protein